MNEELSNIEMALSKDDENIATLIGSLKNSMRSMEKIIVDAYLEHKRMTAEIKERIKQLKSIGDGNA
ncbi:MAG: hypothetical protein PHH14_00620 [Candidatus Margulisbacteria bacterium]|nr:hypothetical protein [Candidatus Margulisiibacteriota bacterium]